MERFLSRDSLARCVLGIDDVKSDHDPLPGWGTVRLSCLKKLAGYLDCVGM